MKPVQSLRLILDKPLGGVENMAIDEAILEAVGAGKAGPTLRFYQWDPPTISLGYFQKIAEWQEQDPVIRELALVRRKTGGGAILHDQELTYSLTLPLNQGLPITDIQSMYKLVHDACIAVLAESGTAAVYRNESDPVNAQRGPFFCFARRHCLDLIVDDKKLMGSAQRRTKNACLQHGSLIINRNYQQQPSAAVTSNSQTDFNLNQFTQDMGHRIGQILHLKTQAGSLHQIEKEKLPELRQQYGSKEWNNQR